jgi:hypothetical protein
MASFAARVQVLDTEGAREAVAEVVAGPLSAY